MINREKHDRMANAIRFLSMDAVEKANSGHPGLPMGAADIATVLFTRFLKYDPQNPSWADRDRFILSAGHGSMLLYSLLYLTGYEDIDIEQIKNFRQLGSRTAGHPEFGHAGGIETTTGPLGQGLGNSVGFALAERILNAKFGDELVDHHTYVLAGDGCLMEGISQEAITLAGHLKLNKLIVFWDDNHITIDGPVSLADSTDQLARFKPHPAGARRAWTATIPRRSPRPSSPRRSPSKSDADRLPHHHRLSAPRPSRARTRSHGSPLGADEIAGARKALGWDAYPPFESALRDPRPPGAWPA
jgi:transketolase